MQEEQTNVEHAKFLSQEPPSAKWKDKLPTMESSKEELDKVPEGKGKLAPTTSHLFKLILPLSRFSTRPDDPPTVLLLHPTQPLSHVSRLIAGSLPPSSNPPDISFRCATSAGQNFQWSDSTDVGDFIKDAANAASFTISIRIPKSPSEQGKDEVIDVQVPTFADRTRFIRRRLRDVENRLKDMEGLKKECDAEAHKGAKRMAISGFGLLVLYWGAVFRLTFYDVGWDVMEPVTYLSGLSTVICGYLWFLYQGREVSYTSVLDRSISTRREALYKARGLDIEHWVDLVGEAKTLRRELKKIAQDYDRDISADVSEDEEPEDSDEFQRDKKVAQQAKKDKESGH